MPASLLTDNAVRVVADLSERIRSLERGQGKPGGEGTFSSGCPSLDSLLPGKVFSRGSIIEWVAGAPGSGAMLLALKVAIACVGEEGCLAVVDSTHSFFPLTPLLLGLQRKNLLLIRPTSKGDARWAVDQALRCRGVSALLAAPESLDHRTFRRWQLAVEQSRVLGLFVRSQSALAEPTWAEARFLVEPRPTEGELRRWQIQLMHAHGSLAGKTAEVAIRYETGSFAGQGSSHPMRLVSSLAGSKALA